MKVNDLQVDSHKNRKRVGRGISAGQGKTAGRGTKGQLSRTGKKLGPTFTGGQGPLVQRIPKARGFKSLRVPAQAVYTEQLEIFNGKTIDNFALTEAGLIATPHHTVKIIVKGELKAKVVIKTQGISKGALDAVTAAGGSFEKVDVPLKQSTKTKEEKEEK